MKRYKIRYKTIEALRNDPSYDPITNKITSSKGTFIPWDQGKISEESYSKEDPWNYWRDAILFEEIIYED